MLNRQPAAGVPRAFYKKITILLKLLHGNCLCLIVRFIQIERKQDFKRDFYLTHKILSKGHIALIGTEMPFPTDLLPLHG